MLVPGTAGVAHVSCLERRQRFWSRRPRRGIWTTRRSSEVGSVCRLCEQRYGVVMCALSVGPA